MVDLVQWYHYSLILILLLSSTVERLVGAVERETPLLSTLLLRPDGESLPRVRFVSELTLIGPNFLRLSGLHIFLLKTSDKRN